MAKSNMDFTIKLKEIIDRNGPEYLTTEPYEVYKELAGSSERKDQKVASAVLYVLVNGTVTGIDTDADTVDQAELSKRIQKGCSLNKRMADRLADIFHSLYSKDHRAEWKEKDHKGLTEFLSDDLTCSWEGFAVWNAGTGSVDCHYEAEFVLEPTDEVAGNEKLTKMLEMNPFTTKETISDFFTKEICDYLDVEFEEYCTCDDYYQPVVEDFEVDEYVKDWCKKNHFISISCEGDGYDDGYEPAPGREWY